MSLQTASILPNDVTKTLICVDGLRDGEYVGRLFNPYLENMVPFTGTLTILRTMDMFFDAISFPQNTFQHRSFFSSHENAAASKRKVEKHMQEDIFQTEQGEKNTFIVQVQYRQNATWQGTVTWTNQNKTQSFRSALELLRLIDEAMTENTPQ